MTSCRLGWIVMVMLLALGWTVAGARGAAGTGFDGGRAYDDLRHIVGFGPRPPGSMALADTRHYLRTQLTAAGVAVTEQPFDADTPVGPMKMANLIGTIPGQRPDRIVIAGHYDTKLFRGFRFVGANDGGSSTAFLLELARVLKQRKNACTIQVLFLDGEEALVDWTGSDHTYGSRHYVEAARRDGSLKTLKALVLVDMIGDRDLRIRREERSTRWLTDIIWNTAKKQGFGDVFVDESMPIEDDHVPFLDADVPAVDVIDLEYGPWHTADDTLDQVSARSLETVGQVILGSVAAIEAHVMSPAAGTGKSQKRIGF